MRRPPRCLRASRPRAPRVKRPRLAPGLALAAAALLGSAPASRASEPRPRALVIGLDGTRGDLLERAIADAAIAPALRRLARAGRFAACPEPAASSCARAHAGPAAGAGFQWVTGTGWASVLTGVGNARHGLRDNEPGSLAVFCESSRVHPSFLALARAAGLATAAGGTAAFVSSAYGAQQQAGVLDYECGCRGERPALDAGARTSCNASERLSLDGRAADRDARLAAWLLARVSEPDASVVMGVFDRIDEAGHRHGFGIGEETLAAVAATDRLLAPILAALEQRAASAGERWLVVVAADHGGHDALFGRGAHDTRAGLDDAVPFGVARFEPGSAGAPSPARPRELVAPVRQMDVHPTVLHWLGLPVAAELDGRVQGLP